MQFQSELDNLRTAIQSTGLIKELALTQRQQTLLELFLFENIMQEAQNKMNAEEAAQVEKQREEEVKKQQKEGTQSKQPKRGRTVQMGSRELSTDEIWKELWSIFLRQFLDSEQLEREIGSEQEVFAKAIFKVEEVFAKDQSVSEQLSKQSIFKRLIGFLEKSSISVETIQPFKLILK